MEASGLTDVAVVLGEQELSELGLTTPVCQDDKVDVVYLDRDQLLQYGLTEAFLDAPELRKMTINRKTGSLVVNEGELPFLIDVEGSVLAVATVTMSSDNLTMVAVICETTIRYFFIKCGSTFAFFTRDPQLSRLLKADDFDLLTLIGIDLLKTNIQKGKRVHDSTSKLASSFWKRLIWGSDVNNYVKTNFAIKRGGKVINANIYLDKAKPKNDIISLNGCCSHFELGAYPTNEVAAAGSKKAKKPKPVPPAKPVVAKPVKEKKVVKQPDVQKTIVIDCVRGNRMIVV